MMDDDDEILYSYLLTRRGAIVSLVDSRIDDADKYGVWGSEGGPKGRLSGSGGHTSILNNG